MTEVLCNVHTCYSTMEPVAKCFNNLFAEFIYMRSGKDGEYYFVTIESDEELEKLKELTLKKMRARNGKLSYASQSSK
ncbi:hypothetical protein [Stygiolobus sp. CP850M]|uniref:hypothetical protein n=1 Tax=Stygiolobus sp. CP850M TaxID=3133134 RepID=UPI003FD34BA4